MLKTYTSKHSSLRDDFKKKTRKKFHDDFLELLDDHYVFYAIWPKNSEKDFVDDHFRMLVGKIFKPAGFGCLILALEKDSPQADKEKEDLKKLWDEIKDKCEWFHVSPKDIFPNASNLEPAKFEENDWYFDKRKYGIFVKRDAFEKAKIGKEHQLPSEIGDYKLDGNIFGDIDLERIAKNKSPLDEYYFLPCK